MKNRKDGFTLVEVIVAMALIGIIAAGLIPAFAAQFKMTVDTKNITTQSFDAQGEMENVIFEVKNALVNPTIDETAIEGVQIKTKSIFGKDIDMYKLEKAFPLNTHKNFVVYLSKKLADMEVRQLLVAESVSIDVSTDTLNQLADLKKTPKPVLTGKYNENTDPNWYANIFEWYKSKEGDPDPVFPDDFEKIIIPGITPDHLNDLTALANRYIVFTVTPVDIHGVRGNEVRSSNTVYVLGEEWRSGLFAWIDKNQNVSYSALDDVKIDKREGRIWPLYRKFDNADNFLDPDNPSISLNPSNGPLYVPMGIGRGSGDTHGPLIVNGSDEVDWTVDKGINVATDITVNNAGDVRFKTDGGNIILYQYIELDNRGDAVFLGNGMPKLINLGPKLTTSNGEIIFEMSGRGDIILQNYSKLISSRDITLKPYGHINTFKSELEAGESITLDSTKGNLFPGNRDITIKESIFKLKPNLLTGRNIAIDTLNKLTVSDSVFTGNTNGGSKILFTAPGGIDLTEVRFENADIHLNNNTVMKGGGWISGSNVTIPDGKIIKFGSSSGKVSNRGSLTLGNTGGADFYSDNHSDMEKPLALYLEKAAGNKVTISTNYGRNVAYADSKGYESAPVGNFENLGSGQTNLKYKVSKTSGKGKPSVNCGFDGSNSISIDATGSSEEGYSNYYELTVEDKYARNVSGTIRFRVSAMPGGSPSIQILDSDEINATIIFNSNGGTTVSPSSVIVRKGETVVSLPSHPSRNGYDFLGWTTEKDGGNIFDENYIVEEDMTVFAKWSNVPLYKVIFYKNFGPGNGGVHSTIDVERGLPIGKLPDNPERLDNYVFSSWNKNPNGNGVTVNENTIITANLDVYAIYKASYKVTFNSNGGDTDANPSTMKAGSGEGLGLLPAPPTREGYSFTGWNTRQNGSGTIFNENTPITKDITVYAQWDKTTATVTFDNNGGSGVSPTQMSTVKGSSLGSLPNPPSHWLFTFDGWNTQSNGRGSSFTNNTPVNEDMTVYAQWVFRW